MNGNTDLQKLVALLKAGNPCCMRHRMPEEDRERIREMFKTLWTNALDRSPNCVYICCMISFRRYFFLLFLFLATAVAGRIWCPEAWCWGCP